MRCPPNDESSDGPRYLIGTHDKIIPPAAELAMAKRADSTVSYFDAGHLGLVSDPGSVMRVIERAARATG